MRRGRWLWRPSWPSPKFLPGHRVAFHIPGARGLGTPCGRPPGQRRFESAVGTRSDGSGTTGRRPRRGGRLATLPEPLRGHYLRVLPGLSCPLTASPGRGTSQHLAGTVSVLGQRREHRAWDEATDGQPVVAQDSPGRGPPARMPIPRGPCLRPASTGVPDRRVASAPNAAASQLDEPMPAAAPQLDEPMPNAATSQLDEPMPAATAR